LKIKFFCPRWGSEHIEWKTFLTDVKNAGYSGIEWFPFAEAFDKNEVFGLLADLQLEHAFVMTVTKPFSDTKEYCSLLKDDLEELIGLCPLSQLPSFISAQTGREYFSEPEIFTVLSVCDNIEQQYGIPIYQETHRNKWSYVAHNVYQALQRKNDLKITLDVSHWFCVSESYLNNQQLEVAKAIQHTHHIHARVGHTQGPQVFDPAFPEYAEALSAHLNIWDEWMNVRKQKGYAECTITPEFGPPPYLTMGNRAIDAQKEQWRLNLWIKQFLQNRFNVL